MTNRNAQRRQRENPFKKATRGKQHIKLLVSGPSGSGKSLTAIQVACHLAAALGRPGSVAVIDSEDARAKLYSYDNVIGQLYLCRCEQCSRLREADRMPLEFDHMDLRDHNPMEWCAAMKDALEFGYAVVVLDNASHEWCGRNGCLEEVDKLKGDGKGRQTDNAWNVVTAKHNGFLADLRSIPMHLIATARTKPDRDNPGHETIVQRENKDGPFEYEFTFWGALQRGAEGCLHMKTSRSGEFQGCTWDRAGKHAAEQLAYWAGHVKPQAAVPVEDPPQAEGGRAEPEKRPAAARPPRAEEGPPEVKQDLQDPKTCKHVAWEPVAADPDGAWPEGTRCVACHTFRPEESPPEEEDPDPDPTPTEAPKNSGTSPTEQAQATGTEGQPGLTHFVESVTAILNRCEQEVSNLYMGELRKCGEDAAKLSNLLACVQQVERINASLTKVDEATATKWIGFLADAGSDLAKLEKMAPWCEGQVPANAEA